MHRLRQVQLLRERELRGLRASRQLLAVRDRRLRLLLLLLLLQGLGLLLQGLARSLWLQWALQVLLGLLGGRVQREVRGAGGCGGSGADAWWPQLLEPCRSRSMAKGSVGEGHE